MALTVVAAYDVADDGRRSRLAALLQSVGDRVQRSVFVLVLSPGDLDDLRARVLGTIDPDHDSFYLFRQCSPCWEAVASIGQADPPRRVLYWCAL